MTIEFYISHEKVKEIFCFSAKKKFPAAVYSKIEKRKSSIFHFRAWFWLIKWLLYDIVSFILAGYQKKKKRLGTSCSSFFREFCWSRYFHTFISRKFSILYLSICYSKPCHCSSWKEKVFLFYIDYELHKRKNFEGFFF